MAENDWTRPDQPPKCTYSPNIPLANSPHQHLPFSERPRIASSVLDLVQNSPLVRLQNITKEDDIKCEVLMKCEFLSSGGSVKDRIAKRMVEAAELSGQLQPGDTIIEPSSGNTGIGLALVAAVKGYRCIVVMPEKMSKEKESVLRALGAQIVRTRTSANYDDPDSHLRVAEDLQRNMGPRAHILNQYLNPYNPIAHYDQTAEEILRDCTESDGKIKLDLLVSGAGTGGTVTGLSRKIKERVPSCRIVAVDPVGSILAHSSQECGHYEVEGIGYDFIPSVLNRDCVDFWCKTSDKESFEMARRLISREGFLCGGSSGAAVVAAFKSIKDLQLGKDSRVVVILPDSIRNYITKFLDDTWMYSCGFLDFPEAKSFVNQWKNFAVEDLVKNLSKPMRISVDVPLHIAVGQLEQSRCQVALVVEATNRCTILGVLDGLSLVRLLSGTAKPNDHIDKVMNKHVKQIILPDIQENIARQLIHNPYIIVRNEQGSDAWIVTQTDFLQWTISKC